MSVSSISHPTAYIPPTINRTQNAPKPVAVDHDGDSDDFGGAPDSDGVRGASLNIKA